MNKTVWHLFGQQRLQDEPLVHAQAIDDDQRHPLPLRQGRNDAGGHDLGREGRTPVRATGDPVGVAVGDKAGETAVERTDLGLVGGA